MKDSLAMEREDRRTYTYDRKLHTDPETQEEQLANLSQVIIHTAYTTGEARRLLRGAGVVPVEYRPKKSTEAHFYDQNTGNLHVVNSRGVVRLRRDEDLAWSLEDLLERKIKCTINHHGGDPRLAYSRFQEFGFNLMDEVFAKIEEQDGLHSLRKGGRVFVLMGPHESLALESQELVYDPKRVKGYENDFLSYRILNLDNNLVINFDYIFADQARNVLSQLFTTLSAKYRDVDVHVFHYGKVGILDEARSVGDICLPTAALDEEVMWFDQSIFPMRNMLVQDPLMRDQFTKTAGEGYDGTTVNTISVLKQTRNGLSRAQELGGAFIDMEWLPMAALALGYKNSYPNLGRILFYFAGVGSDKPLVGKTLGNTPYSRDAERRVAKAQKGLIKII
ncbi:MAG: hypothetical protein ABIJ21_08385 [Nanoarchaeota archaeon]